MIWVVLSVNGAIVKECPVDRELFVGRTPSSDLHIMSTEVSSRHAKISPRAHGAVITDLNSTNGTFLNGEKRLASGVELALEPGMRICIGPGIFEIKRVDDPAAKPRVAPTEEKMFGTMVIGTDDTQQGIVNEAKFRSARPRIVIALETDRRTVPLEEVSTEIGREGCAVTINHPSVSGKHARINYENGFFILRDLQSRNGTFVDGLPVPAPTPLGTQAAITFGTVECLFVQEPPKQGMADYVAPEVLAAHVVTLGKATRHQADQILQEQAATGRALGELFVERGILPPRTWSEIFAHRKLIGTLNPAAAKKGMHPLVWVSIGLLVAAIAVWAVLHFMR
jgi:pSer/pThr/pTyr-binding forkhead associated (FHA) protein